MLVGKKDGDLNEIFSMCNHSSLSHIMFPFQCVAIFFSDTRVNLCILVIKIIFRFSSCATAIFLLVGVQIFSEKIKQDEEKNIFHTITDFYPLPPCHSPTSIWFKWTGVLPNSISYTYVQDHLNEVQVI